MSELTITVSGPPMLGRATLVARLALLLADEGYNVSVEGLFAYQTTARKRGNDQRKAIPITLKEEDNG